MVSFTRYKGGVTPLRIAYEAGDKSKIDYNKLIKFKPVIPDLFSSDYCKMFPQSVHHVPESNMYFRFVVLNNTEKTILSSLKLVTL